MGGWLKEWMWGGLPGWKWCGGNGWRGAELPTGSLGQNDCSVQTASFQEG